MEGRNLEPKIDCHHERLDQDQTRTRPEPDWDQTATGPGLVWSYSHTAMI